MKLLKKISRILQLFKTVFYYKIILKKIGFKSFIIDALTINHPQNISIGNNVRVGYKSWLAASPFTKSVTCELVIEDGCMIGNFNHIFATQSVLLQKKVLTADKVYISDNLHNFENIHVPILEQGVKQIRPVVIGEGSWLGENVCVLGASVGKNSVIGANSVVTKDIPDYCVAVGSPAKVIKKYCHDTSQWKKTNQSGDFIQ